MLNEYQKDYPEDNLSRKLQLQEATDIIKVFDRVGDRWNTVETTLDDLENCILSSLTLTDTDGQIERVEAERVEYAGKFRKLKQEKREILKRCSEFIAKVRKVNDKANINNNQINSTSSSKKAEDILIYATDIPNKDEKEQGCVDVESSITKEHGYMDNEEHGSSSCKDCEFTSDTDGYNSDTESCYDKDEKEQGCVYVESSIFKPQPELKPIFLNELDSDGQGICSAQDIFNRVMEKETLRCHGY